MPVVLTTNNGEASSKITFICGLGLVMNASAKSFSVLRVYGVAVSSRRSRELITMYVARDSASRRFKSESVSSVKYVRNKNHKNFCHRLLVKLV